MKSLRNKFAVCALVIGSFVGVGDAAQVVVFEAPLKNWNQEVSADFAVNRELGRAWVEVQLESPALGEEGPDRELIWKSVEGLYYDLARKQVLYQTASENVVCADDASFLWRTYLKSTGRCRLITRTEQRKIDDGFNVSKRTVAKVLFDARTSAVSEHAAASKGMTRETTVSQ